MLYPFKQVWWTVWRWSKAYQHFSLLPELTHSHYTPLHFGLQSPVHVWLSYKYVESMWTQHNSKAGQTIIIGICIIPVQSTDSIQGIGGMGCLGSVWTLHIKKCNFSIFLWGLKKYFRKMAKCINNKNIFQASVYKFLATEALWKRGTWISSQFKTFKSRQEVDRLLFVKG